MCDDRQVSCSDARSRLRAEALVLLRTSSGSCELSAATAAAHALFSELAGFGPEPGDPDEISDIRLPGGSAISPRTAALCLTDHVRTAMFVRGVNDTIADVRARFPEETIDVVYAGCGPFAPLFILPFLVSEWERIRFTLIDVHERSLEAARRIIGILGLDRFVRDYVCADAAMYRHPGQHGIHVVLTETMRRALEDETQVAITANLAPQLRRGGVLLPRRISVMAYLVDRAKEFTPPEAPERDRIPIGEVLEVSARTARTLHAPSAVRLNLAKVSSDRYMLALLTYVDVYGAHSIDEYAAAITSPLWLREFRADETPAVLEFVYETTSKPGFRVSFGMSRRELSRRE